MKYIIYSNTLGEYFGFYNGTHRFTHNPPEIQHTFLSESGARSFIEVMPHLAETPNDCEVIPVFDDSSNIIPLTL